MTFLRGWNPRLHLAAAIGWAIFALVSVAASIAANLAAAEADRHARADAQALLTEFATQVRDAVAMQLETRRSLLQATAGQIEVSGGRGAGTVERHLQAVRAQFPEFVWLGAADSSGIVRHATTRQGLGTEVKDAVWFLRGLERPYVSDVQESTVALDHAPPEAARALGRRVVHVAVPLRLGNVGDAGVLFGDLSWTWVEQVLGRMQQALDRQRQLEVMLISGDGIVRVGPPNWLDRQLSAQSDLTEDGAYLTGVQAHRRVADGVGLGWTAVVRQRADPALAAVRATRRTVFLIVFVAGLLSAAAAVPVTRLLLRRLMALAAEAEAVRRGVRQSLAVPKGADEVSRIGATLAVVVDHLQREKQALQTLNTQLDRRVAERTERIARMAEEAHHAAVTRDRLRLARDLHDTLAQSLMALLTQIRLVRKLRGRMDPVELDAELGRAESVAASGLGDARAAIAQMRGNSVRDAGLGPALRTLLDKLCERSGIQGTWVADPQAEELVGERAEVAFRVAEEVVRNVQRHAQAHRVDMTLRWLADAEPAIASHLPSVGRGRVQLTITDDGRGFDISLPRPGHYGLLGIREQALLIEARFHVHSEPGQGTRIELEFEA